jgi:DNA-binding transcriptional ArsR family regulator
LKQRASSIAPRAEKTAVNGDLLLVQLVALASPHRLRILATLVVGGRQYVSQLARDVGMSRPLLHLHLKKLEDAGLVTTRLELSDEGKALNFIEVTDFEIDLTPASVTKAAKSLSANMYKSD